MFHIGDPKADFFLTEFDQLGKAFRVGIGDLAVLGLPRFFEGDVQRPENASVVGTEHRFLQWVDVEGGDDVESQLVLNGLRIDECLDLSGEAEWLGGVVLVVVIELIIFIEG